MADGQPLTVYLLSPRPCLWQVTVYGMFEVLAVPRGEWLLQTAAGSVLGRQMVQVGSGDSRVHDSG